MALPNFLCVGAQKSGTTTLHDILVQHPDIYLPDIKETKFFQNNELYFKGLEFYKREFFNECKGEKAIGEVDPDYMYFEYVPERIYKDLGKDVKLIFMLRNPVDRAYSNYWMTVRRGYEKEEFLEAIKLENDRIKDCEFNKKHFSYLRRGFYFEQVERYLRFFSKKQMFFIIFEKDFVDLTARKNTIKSLLSFLEVDVAIDLNLNIKSNPASLYKMKVITDFLYSPNNVQRFIRKFGKLIVPNPKLRMKIKHSMEEINQKPFNPPPLKNEIRRLLLEKYFIDDIKRLENLLKRNLICWYEM